MKQIQLKEKIFLSSKLLADEQVLHFFSTKIGWEGYSRFTGDSEDEYKYWREALAKELELAPVQLIFPRQTHGTGVRVVRNIIQLPDIPDTDALITNQPNICICVQTADCVPILLFDPVKRTVAAIHSGWRGTVKKIVQKTIIEMSLNFGCNPEDIVASIGPSISPQRYEVGEDVIAQVRQVFSNDQNILKPATKYGKAFFDLWQANKTLLIDAGVPENQIGVMGICTYSEDELFYSARRDGATTGRMVSGIILK